MKCSTNLTSNQIPLTGQSAKEGIPLRLIIHIHDFGRIGSCTPLKGAHVDIWHANSQGLYSDIQQAGTEGKKYPSWIPSDR